MSYYDFNNHYWSPQEVCSQSVPLKSNKEKARKRILIVALTVACTAVWTPLLLQSLVPAIQSVSHQGVSSAKHISKTQYIDR